MTIFVSSRITVLLMSMRSTDSCESLTSINVQSRVYYANQFNVKTIIKLQVKDRFHRTRYLGVDCVSKLDVLGCTHFTTRSGHLGPHLAHKFLTISMLKCCVGSKVGLLAGTSSGLVNMTCSLARDLGGP